MKTLPQFRRLPGRYRSVVMAAVLTLCLLFAISFYFWFFIEQVGYIASLLMSIGLTVAAGLVPVALFGVYRGLPLLTKELQEQSSRRRTFVMRAVYASLAFLAAICFSFEMLHRNHGNKYAILGQGQQLFELFAALQFFGIYIFMPAMTCGLITTEKERDTLSLLFLTRLSPWGILSGKFLSRLFPMLLLMSMSLPLFGFAYSLGGFDQSLVWSALWIMVLTTLQVGALGLACSACFTTTTGAFIGTYLLGLVMLFGPPVLDEFFGWTAWVNSLRVAYGFDTFFGFDQYMISALMFAPVILFDGPMRGATAYVTLLRSVPIATLTVLLFFAARFFLVRRAFVTTRNPLVVLFRHLDRIFKHYNQRFGNVELSRESNRLPGSEPIAWRETHRKAMGTLRYLIRVFVALEFPVLFTCTLAVGNSRESLEYVGLLVILLWFISTLLIASASGSLIAAERSHQTLEALLSSPLTNREILRQKLKGVRRLMFVLSWPLLTVYACGFFMRLDLPHLNNQSWKPRDLDHLTLTITYGLTSLSTLLIYFPMISWLSFLIGMKVKSHGKAIITALAVLTAWCLLPLMLLIPVIAVNGPGQDSHLELLTILSPMMIIPFNEFSEYRYPIEALIYNTVLYGTIALALRTYCMTQIDTLFGRKDSPVRQLPAPVSVSQ